MNRATILIQATNPGLAETAERLPGAILDTLDATGIQEATVVRTLGPYDAVAQVDTDPDTLARAVLAVQDLDDVSRTLTLPHV